MTRPRITGITALSIVTACLSAPVPAQAQCPAAAHRTASSACVKPDVIDTAASAGDFRTLVAAVQAAGLVDALKGEGPFTVFAPTDDAFAKLPRGTVEALLRPENRATLRGILTYHVVAGDVPASAVTRLSGAPSLNGQKMAFGTAGTDVLVDGVRVVKADIACGNGRIHVIDSVLMPTDENIVQVARSTGMFQTLLSAATEAGLAGPLSGDGPFTVLAPTDDAFDRLPAGTVERLLRPENREQLVAILKYHVIPSRAFAADAVRAGSAPTLEGADVRFDLRDGRLYADNARIVKTDINASNGVVHVIDAVLMPPAGT